MSTGSIFITKTKMATKFQVAADLSAKAGRLCGETEKASNRFLLVPFGFSTDEF